MKKLIASTFVSLDGILQAPGGPDEDRTGGFPFGGWTFPHWDGAMGESMDGFDGKGRELVLGRRTYEIFEAYWPYQPVPGHEAEEVLVDRSPVDEGELRGRERAAGRA
jgi:dihydrofolate reductase